MTDFKDILAKDEDNNLRVGILHEGILLYQHDHHACKMPRPESVTPGSLWQCAMCEKVWRRRNNQKDEYTHRPSYFWRKVSHRRAKGYLLGRLKQFEIEKQEKAEKLAQAQEYLEMLNQKQNQKALSSGGGTQSWQHQHIAPNGVVDADHTWT